MYRRARWGEPPKVFCCLETPPSNEDVLPHRVRIWIRNCPSHWLRQVVADLKRHEIVTDARVVLKDDLVWRAGFYNQYFELAGVTEHDTSLLKELVALMFRRIQGTRVEWMGMNRFLNLKVWHRKEVVLNIDH